MFLKENKSVFKANKKRVFTLAPFLKGYSILFMENGGLGNFLSLPYFLKKIKKDLEEGFLTRAAVSADSGLEAKDELTEKAEWGAGSNSMVCEKGTCG